MGLPWAISIWVVTLSLLPWQLHARPVEFLPGYGKPPTNHHAGFVEVDKTSGTKLYYYLVESQSEPDKDPLLWWMSGGPGASSLVGLFLENGPLLLNDAEELMNNPYAWNRKANVLYVEFGPGVGYSFCSNSSMTGPDLQCQQSQGDCSPCDASDKTVASQNVALLRKLLVDVFPSLAGRPLFLTGESYAGVYVPSLAAAILEEVQDTSVINLHGIWITDPCLDNKAQFGWMDLGVEFCFQKGLISKEVRDTLSDPGQDCYSGRTPIGDRIRKVETLQCKRAWRLYDLATAGVGNAVHPAEVPNLPMYIDPLNAFGPAGHGNPETYLTRADVRAALHANESPNKVYHLELGNNGYKNYEMQHAACNINTKDGQPSILDVLRKLVNATAQKKAEASSMANLKRIIISSGDIDPVVALHGTEAAVHQLGYPVAPGGDRRPWFYNSTATAVEVLARKSVTWGQKLHAVDAGAQVGGFVSNFATIADGTVGPELQFVTMRASGHMVPAYVPQASLHVICNALLEGKQLAPRLAEDWDTSSDEVFYGKSEAHPGTFARWARAAMTSEYVDGSENAMRPQEKLMPSGMLV